MRYLIALLILVSLTAVSSVAKPASSPDVWKNVGFEYQTPVEQWTQGGALQPDRNLWVVNPTLVPGEWTWVNKCLWDGDDSEQWQFNGNIDPGQSVSITRCLYADADEKISYLEDYNADPSLTVSVTVGSTTVTGQNAVCVLGPDYDTSGDKIQPVAGSNPDPALQGKAVLTQATFTITNTSNRTIRRQTAGAYFGLYISFGSNQWFGDKCAAILGNRYGYDPAWQTGSR